MTEDQITIMLDAVDLSAFYRKLERERLANETAIAIKQKLGYPFYRKNDRYAINYWNEIE